MACPSILFCNLFLPSFLPSSKDSPSYCLPLHSLILPTPLIHLPCISTHAYSHLPQICPACLRKRAQKYLARRRSTKLARHQRKPYRMFLTADSWAGGKGNGRKPWFGNDRVHVINIGDMIVDVGRVGALSSHWWY